jgi:hypothetical protein
VPLSGAPKAILSVLLDGTSSAILPEKSINFLETRFLPCVTEFFFQIDDHQKHFAKTIEFAMLFACRIQLLRPLPAA